MTLHEGKIHRKSPLKMLVSGSVSVALAWLLSCFKILHMPQGGGVSLEMVPLVLFSLFYGVLPGLLAGVSYGLLHFTQSIFVIHPVQFLLDYPLAFGAAAVAGFFAGKRRSPLMDVLAVLSAFGARFACHVLSGVLFLSLFVKALPQNPLFYVMVYNATYLLPDALIAVLIVPLLAARLDRVYTQEHTRGHHER
ncbi:MAG: energy-coupled thiamine transporter ThiT [Candidatus Eremiobacteraeota bacterium]|nr:energy-coupled thiamine transporter ThiT [Candidatus Eremiobacteraeota bacterium]